MVYKKLVTFTIVISIIAAITCNFVFADNLNLTDDKVYDSVLKVLVGIQKYSWPLVAIVFIYAMYQYYIIGSELIENKISGQKLIVGISIFMVIVQCMPLFYAFFLVN